MSIPTVQKFNRVQRAMLWRCLTGAALITLVVLSGCVDIREPEAPRLVKLTQAYNRFYNSHKLDSLAAMYHDSVVFELVGLDSTVGKEALLEYNDYERVVNNYQHLRGLVAHGDTVLCSLITERNSFWSAAKFSKILYQPVYFIFEDSLLRRIRLSPNPYSMQAIRSTLRPFFHWMFENHPDVFDEVAPLPSRRLLMNGYTAHRLVNMMKEFQTLPDSTRGLPRMPATPQPQSPAPSDS